LLSQTDTAAAALFSATSETPLMLQTSAKSPGVVTAVDWAIEQDPGSEPIVGAVSVIETPASGLTAATERLNLQTFDFEGRTLANIDLDPVFAATYSGSTTKRATNGLALVSGSFILEVRSGAGYSIVSLDALTAAQNWRLDSSDEPSGGGSRLQPVGAEMLIVEWHESWTGLDPRDGHTVWADDTAESAYQQIGRSHFLVHAGTLVDGLTGQRTVAGVTSVAYDPVSEGIALGFFSPYQMQSGDHSPAYQVRDRSGAVKFEIMFDDPERLTALQPIGAFDGRTWVLAGSIIVVDSQTGALDPTSPTQTSGSSAQVFAVPITGTSFWTLLHDYTSGATGQLVDVGISRLVRHPQGQIEFSDLELFASG
jgi:hypothetical protein